MKAHSTAILAILALILVGALAYGTTRQRQSSPALSRALAPTATSSISSDPQDIVPGLYANPITNVATQEGFTLESVAIENNTDATGKVVSDHLEFALKNTTSTDLTNFTAYYTMTDMVTQKKEGYAKQLKGFTLKARDTQTLHFDGSPGAGHFTVNKGSIFYKSVNKVHFEVMVSTPGYKVQAAQIDKSEGGAETKD